MIKRVAKIPDTTSLKIRQSVERRFQESKVLIDTWDIPNWDDRKVSKQYSYHPWNMESFPVTSNSHIKQASAGTDPSQVADTARSGNLSPPPAILIRASKRLNVGGAEGLIDVDVNRDSKLLGWESYPYDFIKSVYDVPSDHYDIFDTEGRVRKALDFKDIQLIISRDRLHM